MTLTISTFWRSCPDALHYYGTVRDEEGKVRLEIKRQNSMEAVISVACKKFKHLTIEPKVIHV